MSLTKIHLEVIETDDCMLFSILLFNLVQFIHFGLYYIACTLISLTEMGQRCLPTFGSHTTELKGCVHIDGLADCGVVMGDCIGTEVVSESGLMNQDSGVRSCLRELYARTCIS